MGRCSAFSTKSGERPRRTDPVQTAPSSFSTVALDFSSSRVRLPRLHPPLVPHPASTAQLQTTHVTWRIRGRVIHASTSPATPCGPRSHNSLIHTNAVTCPSTPINSLIPPGPITALATTLRRDTCCGIGSLHASPHHQTQWITTAPMASASASAPGSASASASPPPPSDSSRAGLPSDAPLHHSSSTLPREPPPLSPLRLVPLEVSAWAG